DARRQHRCARRTRPDHRHARAQGYLPDLLPVRSRRGGDRSAASEPVGRPEPVLANAEAWDMPDQSVVRRAGETSDCEDDEINLLDLLIVLAKHKRLVLGLPLIAGVVAAGISLLLPNIYTGFTRILPPQQSASAASALINQLGGALGGLAGAAGG